MNDVTQLDIFRPLPIPPSPEVPVLETQTFYLKPLKMTLAIDKILNSNFRKQSYKRKLIVIILAVHYLSLEHNYIVV